MARRRNPRSSSGSRHRRRSSISMLARLLIITARRCNPRGSLQQERALSNPWLTAEKYKRSGHCATAEHAIKLWDAEWESRRAVSASKFQRLRSSGASAT